MTNLKLLSGLNFNKNICILKLSMELLINYVNPYKHILLEGVV